MGIDDLVTVADADAIDQLAKKAIRLSREAPRAEEALRQLALQVPDAYFEVIDALRPAAASGPEAAEWKRRHHLIRLVTDHRFAALAPHVVARLRDRADPHLRWLVRATAVHGSADAVPVLAALLADRELGLELRVEALDALEALEALGIDVPARDLVAALPTSRGELRPRIAAGLAGRSDAVEPLLELLRDAEDLELRVLVIDALATTGDERIVAPLETLLVGDPETGRAAGRALAPLLGAGAADELVLGAWLATGRGADVRRWLEDRASTLEPARLDDVRRYVLARLGWLETGEAVEVAAGLLATGAGADEPAIRALLTTVRALATQPDTEWQDLEVGDQDMWTVTRQTDHGPTRAAARRYLETLGMGTPDTTDDEGST